MTIHLFNRAGLPLTYDTEAGNAQIEYKLYVRTENLSRARTLL